MTYPPHVQSRINQIKSRNAWQSVIEAADPLVMVTLGTNGEMGSERLRDLIDRALLDLDRRRLGNVSRVYKRSALSRTCAFIIPEKVGLNTHAHLMVYSPMRNRFPSSTLIGNIDETRIRNDFIGYKALEYDQNLYKLDKALAPRLEVIWRELVPGGHYHARRTDANVADGIG